MEIRNNNFRLQLKEGMIKDYEKIILTHVNDIFMPMGFVSSDEGEIISYNCSGYSSLAQCRITEVMEALEILERTLQLVSRASEYLIAPANIMLTSDTIYYNKENKQVRIAYVPVQPERASLRENISGFINELKNRVSGTGETYLEKVKEQMNENNYYIQDMINVIGEIRRNAAGKHFDLEGVWDDE